MRRVLTFGLGIVMLVMSACGKYELDVCIFESIDECRSLASFGDEDFRVEVYALPDDGYLNGIDYEDFFACRYCDEGVQFEIFAYEFENWQNANEYFENVTGRHNENRMTFSDVSGMSEFIRFVLYDNKSYLVCSGVKNREKVIEILNSIFSIDLY